ncbi:MAG: hypothetical protein B6I28_03095 [Fusobacteriia bacterium 4572_132]|nr:MAG: hypothetical protein B6I28_03095 [Fusobacteriia bacterium 4572_132]
MKKMKMPRIRVAGILKKKGKILLIKHKKKEKEYWLLPGGGVDYGETFQEALKREFKEETALKIEVGNLKFISESIAPDMSRHIINIFFEVKYISGELRLGNEDILKELKYLDENELNNQIVYPNIKNELLETTNFIKYLGNRWE